MNMQNVAAGRSNGGFGGLFGKALLTNANQGIGPELILLMDKTQEYDQVVEQFLKDAVGFENPQEVMTALRGMPEAPLQARLLTATLLHKGHKKPKLYAKALREQFGPLFEECLRQENPGNEERLSKFIQGTFRLEGLEEYLMDILQDIRNKGLEPTLAAVKTNARSIRMQVAQARKVMELLQNNPHVEASVSQEVVDAVHVEAPAEEVADKPAKRKGKG